MMRRFKPKLALTTMMKAPGGLYVAQALKRADAAMAELQEACLTGIDDLFDRLDEKVRNSRGAPFDVEGAYVLSSAVIDLCGGVSDTSLETAARYLCDYLDRMAEGERLDLRGVEVHVASMRLLHRSTGTPAQRAAILTGLSQVVGRERK